MQPSLAPDPMSTGPQIDGGDLLNAMRDRLSKALAEADEWKAAWIGAMRKNAALEMEVARLKEPAA